jgi:carbamoyl-phosphate synthase large subunit
MQKQLNILMLGGAKRVSMGRMFKAAGEAVGFEVSLFSYELSRDVPIAEIATVIIGKRWRDPELMADLREVVTRHAINIIIPFVDPAVEVAAQFCNANHDCYTPMRDDLKAHRLFDKVEADADFRALGFPLPLAPDELGPDAKIIAKPRCGSASQGIKVLNRDEYQALKVSSSGNDYLYQQYIESREEITVDCYVDSHGEVICTVPRIRLAIAGGEVLDTVTIADTDLIELSMTVLKRLALRGPITLQFLRQRNADGTTGKPMLMEINPRLGGGAVCAVHAGANIPAFIIADWMGQPIAPCTTWKAGVKICRYMQEVVFRP